MHLISIKIIIDGVGVLYASFKNTMNACIICACLPHNNPFHPPAAASEWQIPFCQGSILVILVSRGGEGWVWNM